MTATDTRSTIGAGSGCAPFHEPRSGELHTDRDPGTRALLLSLLAPFRMAFALLALVVVIGSAAQLSVPVLVQRGIDHGIPPIKDGASNRELMFVVGALCIAVLVHAASRLFFLHRFGRIRQMVLLDIRRRLFRHFQQLDVAFLDRYTTGRVVSRLTNDVDAVHDMLATGFDGLILAALTTVGTAIMLVVLDLRLGLMCLVAFPFQAALVQWFRSESSAAFREVRDSTALVIGHFVETMTGIRVVQAYRREPRNQEIFEDIVEQYRAINERTFKLVAVFLPGVRLIGNITIGMMLVYGGYRVLRGEMTIGTFAAFLLYLGMFFEPLQDVTAFLNTFQSAASALEKFAAVLAERPGIRDRRATAVAGTRAAVSGTVAFNNVHFGYLPDQPVVSGLSLTVPAGQTVALVGATGCGKTTIAELIARFHDPTSGSITLDGTDLRDIARTDLRRCVVMVTQENFLFSGTVADNIRFGRPDASDAQVREAAATVGADRFIAALPDGYHSHVANRDVQLSAGQRQLIALARAFLADPAVLIVDAATSLLDGPTERMVQRALAVLLADRTAVIIAHRLAGLDVVDRVVVLGEQGQVVAHDMPDQLSRPIGRG